MKYKLSTILLTLTLLLPSIDAYSQNLPSSIKTHSKIPLYQVDKKTSEKILKYSKVLKEEKISIDKYNRWLEGSNNEKNQARPKNSEEECHPKSKTLKSSSPSVDADIKAPNVRGVMSVADSRDFAIALLVIIGAFVIIYWIVSVPILIFNSLFNPKCLQFKHQLFLSGETFSFSNSNQKIKAASLTYSFYFKHKFQNAIFYGLSANTSKYNYSFFEKNNQDDSYKIKKNGYSFQVGPSLLIPLYNIPNYYGINLFLDFLFGSTFNSYLGSITSGKIGLQLSLSNNLLVGLGIAGNKFGFKNFSNNENSLIDYKDSNKNIGLSYFFRLGLEF